MRTITRFAGVAGMLASFSFAVPASAATFFVANTGNDANSGNFNNPFRNIQAAVNVASDGDIILCIPPFSQTDQVIIPTIGLTINCPNGVLNPGQLPGITINGGAGNDTVTINGLDIVVQSGAGNGPAVQFNRGHKLIMEDLTLNGVGKGTGVLDRTSTDNSELIIRNSTVNGFNNGIVIDPRSAPGTHHVNLDRVDVLNNGTGILLDGGTTFLQNSKINSNNIGIDSNGNTLVLKDNTIFANGTGLNHLSSFSAGGNSFFNKGANFNNDSFSPVTTR
jgi:hypothetical protein